MIPSVLAVCGEDIRINARLVTESYQQLMSAELPGGLRVGSFRCISLNAGSQVVSSYNGYDPIELPRQLLEVLPRFDGRPTRQVLAAISAEHGIKLDQALVRRLVDFRILIPAATGSGGS